MGTWKRRLINLASPLLNLGRGSHFILTKEKMRALLKLLLYNFKKAEALMSTERNEAV